MWKIPESVLTSRDDDKALAFVLEQLKDPGGFLKKVRELYSDRDARSFDVVEFKDGRIFERYSQPQKLDGVVVGRVWSFRDATDRRRAEQELRLSVERFRLAARATNDVVWDWDVATDKVWWNENLQTVFGYRQSEFEPGVEGWSKRVHPDEKERVEVGLRAVLEGSGDAWTDEYRFRRADGTYAYILDRGYVIRDENRKPIRMIGAMIEITERKRHEEEVRHLAYHDALTGLPNRNLFQDRLTAALVEAHRSRQPLAVLFLDVDHFKNINDTLGHNVGDLLLQRVSERLLALVPPGDTVARMGGDEFTVLARSLGSLDEAAQLAQRILDALKPPFSILDSELYVTTSIGIAVYPYDGEDPQALMRNADTAMYRAKAEGRNTFRLYTLTMNVYASEQLALGNRLRRALERGEFVVHYQPQVDLRTNRVTGTEALVRWQHPEKGLLAPSEFLAMADETGLIVPLGEWVLRTACAQNRLWQEAGLPRLRIAVNLAARQFQEKRLVVTVARVLHETGLPPECLELEITEDVAIQDVEFSIQTMRNLKNMGIRIVLDDFGTGYSSLSYLRQFPIHKLKLDKSFIHGILTDPNDTAIATAVIALARSLQLRVIAEGVETEQQRRFLLAHQCDEGQGYLFSTPLPAESLASMLKQLP